MSFSLSFIISTSIDFRRYTLRPLMRSSGPSKTLYPVAFCSDVWVVVEQVYKCQFLTAYVVLSCLQRHLLPIDSGSLLYFLWFTPTWLCFCFIIFIIAAVSPSKFYYLHGKDFSISISSKTWNEYQVQCDFLFTNMTDRLLHSK